MKGQWPYVIDIGYVSNQRTSPEKWASHILVSSNVNNHNVHAWIQYNSKQYSKHEVSVSFVASILKQFA